VKKKKKKKKKQEARDKREGRLEIHRASGE